MTAETKRENVTLQGFAEGREMVYTEQIELERKPIYEFGKRLFDIVVSLLAIIVLLIPMVILAVVIRLDSPGSPIYTQTRLGINNKPFTLYKFRSMGADAEKNGAQWAEEGDERVTRLGRILRKTRIDELPQLFNILIGQMSFVGPRPERPEFYDEFDKYIVGFRQRLMVVPGLTGHAQVNGGYSLLPEEKIVYDLEYMKNRSWSMDIKCILRTVQVVLKREGAR